MKYLDLTLSSMAKNLALDEALLHEADQLKSSGSEHELLRVWESPTFAVVVGRGTQVDKEIDRGACERDGIPIFRRCSGGTSVVAGPGCLMYAVLINYADKPELRIVDAAHKYVMETMKAALSQLSGQIEFRGSCDLTIGDRKFSGNALRCKKNFFLYHGTILYNFPLGLLSEYLGTPPHQPDYRRNREHASFVTNFPSNQQAIKSAIRQGWHAIRQTDQWPQRATNKLVDTRYSQSKWNS